MHIQLKDKALSQTLQMKNHHEINYSIYSKQKRELENHEITIKNLNTLSDFIFDEPHTFICNFSFFEEANKACIKYVIKGNLKLICQDTLETFLKPFNISNSIIIVEDDRQAQDSIHEPFICETALINLADIIKEEILLDIPLIPKKVPNTCKNEKKHSYCVTYKEVELDNKVKNPFEILKNYKLKK